MARPVIVPMKSVGLFPPDAGTGRSSYSPAQRAASPDSATVTASWLIVHAGPIMRSDC